MFKFYVRHGMVVAKNHEILSFKQSRWLEKYITFKTKKNETKLKLILRKTSLTYLLMLLLISVWKMFAIV